MTVTLVADGSVLQFRDEHGHPVVPGKIKKAELQRHLVAVVEENERLRQQVSALQTTKPVPPAAGKSRKVDPEVLKSILPGYTPHSRIECPKHGMSQAGGHGRCVACYTEQARGLCIA